MTKSFNIYNSEPNNKQYNTLRGDELTMKWLRKGGFLGLIALLVIVSFVVMPPAYARGRRGGNSSGDLAVAFAGGAAMAAGPSLSAGLSGAATGSALYNATALSSAYGSLAGNLTAAGMTLGGANPDTTRWVSAGVSGLASGISYSNSMDAGLQAGTIQASNGMTTLTDSARTGIIAGRVAGGIAGAELGHSLNESGVAMGGTIGSLGGPFVGGFTEGTIAGTQYFTNTSTNGINTKPETVDIATQNTSYEIDSNVAMNQAVALKGIENFTQSGLELTQGTPVVANASINGGQSIGPGSLEYGVSHGLGRVFGTKSTVDNLGNVTTSLDGSNLINAAAYAGASLAVSNGLDNMMSERSPARAYAGQVAGTAGSVAGHLAEGTFVEGQRTFLNSDWSEFKDKRSGLVQFKPGESVTSQIKQYGEQNRDYMFEQRQKGHTFAGIDGQIKEYRSLAELNGSANMGLMFDNASRMLIQPQVETPQLNIPDLPFYQGQK